MPAQIARLEFLARVADKECQHLLDTDGRLFDNLFTIEEAQKIEADPILAERLNAFVARFGRLQDTVGDKFLPALLTVLAEKTGPAIDNLDKAEKFGFIESADGWMEMRAFAIRWCMNTPRIWRYWQVRFAVGIHLCLGGRSHTVRDRSPAIVGNAIKIDGGGGQEKVNRTVFATLTIAPAR